ncbi:MAG: VCBS repeat-containing protein, partial [Gemmatimonadota bacterium]|nr:VCBS repeat-containing protein [Gemmatimonadota bacterium]
MPRLLAILSIVMTSGLSTTGCGDGRVESSAEENSAERSALFTEVTAEMGIDAGPARPPDGTWALPEIMGGGVGLVDADGDGDLDIVKVETPIPGRDPSASAPVRLFLAAEDGTYRETTATSGLGGGYGQGVTAGDVDGDGHVDLYVTNLGPDALYR